MRIIATVLPYALVAVFAACGRDEPRPVSASGRDASLPQPIVQPMGRISLRESDSLYLAKPSGLAIDTADGHLYVTDGFWGRVLRYSPEGTLVRTYGSRGEGPGELKDPLPVEVAEGIVWVGDVGAGRITRYDREAGEFLGSVQYRGNLTSIQSDRGRLWMGTLNKALKTSLSTWTPGESQVHPLGRIPAEFVQSEPLAGIYTGVEVAAWGDTILAGYMGVNRLSLFRSDGTEIRSFAVPVRARKGQAPDLVKTMNELDWPELFSVNSSLFRMARLPGGSFGLVHYDQTIDGNLIQATVYLSVLSPDFTRACVDREIPVSRDAQPYTAFRGDTLYVLQQEVAGERAATYVDRYRIDEAACPGRDRRLSVRDR